MNGRTLTAGKHALLYIGNGDVTNLRLSDTQGHNVMVEFGGETTGIDAMGSKVMLQGGVSMKKIKTMKQMVPHVRKADTTEMT